jgi:hypothetical protein
MKKSKDPEAESKAPEAKGKAPAAKSKTPETHDDLLTGAAKAIGSAAGKIASLTGVAEPAPAHRSSKPAKLKKKNNTHLPRKMKKAQKKAAAKAQS